MAVSLPAPYNSAQSVGILHVAQPVGTLHDHSVCRDLAQTFSLPGSYNYGQPGSCDQSDLLLLKVTTSLPPSNQKRRSSSGDDLPSLD
ncbi:hypothetical protein PM082_013592 [Marasmius tenuissimus]|nr:hypothetical protein PM082_013592 [Marasmius tenuissimus]